MPDQDRPAAQKDATGLAALLLTVFVAEIAIMELLSPLFARLAPVSAALLDASIVVLVSAFPLWVLFVRPLPDQKNAPGLAQRALLLVQALTGIFIVEYLVMLFLPEFPGLAGRALGLVDAFITATAASIFIWRLLLHPRLRGRDIPLVNTPVRLYVLLLCTVFLSGLLQEIIFPLLAAGSFLLPAKIADALLTTLLGAPLIWLLVVRPLKREAGSEKTRVQAVHAQVIDAIVTLDPLGKVTSFNPAAQKLFGYPEAEMTGASAAVLFEEGAVRLQVMLSCASPTSRSDRLSQSNEVHCRRRDGSIMIMNISISEVRLEEAGAEYLLIMRDITRRKEMEQALLESETRFREIFHQSEDAILFFKPGGCSVIDVNANAERVFGYGKEELADRGLELIADPADLPALAQAVGGIAGDKPVQRDFSARRSDGTGIVASMRGKTMFLQGIPVTYCTFRDVTERVKVEEKKREIQAKLIQANKMTSLGLLVSGVAHEINNPNNFIMANSELLARISRDALKLLNQYHREYGEGGAVYLAGMPLDEIEEHWLRLLDGIQDGSRRVNDIVDNLKGFARQERNQVWREVDVNQVARSAVALMHHELIKFTDNFRLELAERLPPVVGHSQQLGQVIINLLMNACQALPGRQGGVWLTTSACPELAEVVITVRDEGCGMPLEVGQRIMEQFFTTKIDSGGTGLGLSISDSIVKEHGGRLQFTSLPGRGSTFVVRLPSAQSMPEGGRRGTLPGAGMAA